MQWSYDDGELVAVDRRGRRVAVGVDDWRPGPVPPFTVPQSAADTVASGTASRLTLPDSYVGLTRGDQTVDVSRMDRPLVVVEPPVYFRVDSPVKLHVEVPDVDGFVVVTDAGSRAAVDLGTEGGGLVRVGFESRVPDQPPTVTVPRTPDGLADALSLVHRTTTVTTPDRTFPDSRSPPARLRWGDREVPSALASEPTGRDDESDDPVRVSCPPTVDCLFAVAPLATYLGAEVETQPERPPTLRAGNSEYELETDCSGRAFGRILRVVFSLDCLARCGGPHGEPELLRSHVLDDLGLDAATLYGQSMARRVQSYLDAVSAESLSALDSQQPPSPLGEVLSSIPEWRFGVCVQPSLARARALVALLEHLPVVRVVTEPFPTPDSSPGISDERPTTLDLDLVDPPQTPGRTTGWLAEGLPTTGTKLEPAALTRERAPTRDIRIVVVQNHPDTTAEPDGAMEQYDSRESDLDIRPRFEQGLSRGELAAVFADDVDLLHYVGHCNDDGLRCPDGRLSVSSLDHVGTTAFFLNACDSVCEGRRLVERGAVGGVVTRRRVVTSAASRVGTVWAGLMQQGWPVVTALRRAEHAIDETDTGYLTVGDGTYVLTQNDSILPPAAAVSTPAETGSEYELSVWYDHPVEPGASHSVGQPDEVRWLGGDGREYRVDESTVRDVVAELESPLLVDGCLCWPDDALDRLL